MATALHDLTAIEIFRFIVHVIDPGTGELQPAGLDTPIGAGSAFPHDLFQKYILSTLRDEQRRHALFKEPPGTVASAYAAIRTSPHEFVPRTEAIAQHLHAVMEESRYAEWIRAGDVMVALFRAPSDEEGTPPFMAIMKIDPSLVSIRRVVEVGGVRQVVFERGARIPEFAKGQVHKIALLAPERQPQPMPYDLILLDNDLRGTKVAQFFYRGFLESTLTRSAADGTRLVIGGIKAFISDPALPLEPGERKALFDRARDAMDVPVLSIPDLADRATADLPEPKRLEIRDQIVAHYRREALPDEEKIQPDETLPLSQPQVQKMLGTTTLVLDGGVTIRGKTAAFKSIVEQESTRDKQGRAKLTIKSKRLEWR